MENCETRHFRVRVWEAHCLITGITERHEQNIPLFYHHHHQPRDVPDALPTQARSLNQNSSQAGSVSLLSPAVLSVLSRGIHTSAQHPSHFKCEHIRAAKGMYPAGHGIAGVLPPASPPPSHIQLPFRRRRRSEQIERW
ncbi:hypothetical protein B0H10DRAFT_2154868 [Mycena sp. CBHHK59/15]|nr:hypothetical protein B0H10DRAFT_2154868 [Mycena sp. CBHHK59/15]